jgi:hypothetical protein
MALVKMGGGVIQMTGSIAGNTFARNRSGNYVRAKTMPVNPRTALQDDVRTVLSQLSEYWHTTCTAAQRLAWETYAAAVQVKNRLGENIYLTGFNHFIRSNTLRMQAGLAIVDSGPTTLSMPAQDPTFAIEATASDNHVAVTFDNDQPWAILSTAALAVYIGEPQLATRNFFAGPWRFGAAIKGVPSTKAVSPADVDSPFTLITGQKIWAYARILNSDGSVSEPFRASGTVLAGT